MTRINGSLYKHLGQNISSFSALCPLGHLKSVLTEEGFIKLENIKDFFNQVWKMMYEFGYGDKFVSKNLANINIDMFYFVIIALNKRYKNSLRWEKLKWPLWEIKT
ncbi:MAG: hypothetical protein WC858_02855 [Parcubacteria group bacterium]|jgi:hypothetical protein